MSQDWYVKGGRVYRGNRAPVVGEDIRFVEQNGSYAPGTYEVVAVTWVASDGYAIAELTVEPWES